MEIPLKLKQNYIERRKNDLPLLQESIEKTDFNTLQRIGHQLKGNGLTFGFEELAQLGEKLEAAAKSQDAARSAQLAQELINAITKIEL